MGAPIRDQASTRMGSTTIGIANIKRRIGLSQRLSCFFPPDGWELDASPGTIVARSHRDYDPVTVADSTCYVGLVKTWYEDSSPTSPSQSDPCAVRVYDHGI
jgi:hypothetical protein